MRRLSLRPNPLVLQLGFLAVLAAGVGLDQTAARRRAGLVEAKRAYDGAMAATRMELAARVGRAAGDKALTQNLNWKLQHSVQSALAGRLEEGALDQIVLVDPGCNERGSAKTPGHLPPWACDFGKDDAATRTDQPYWLAASGEAAPALYVTRALGADGAELYAVGMVALDDDWIGRHPDLKTALAKLNLTLGADDGALTLSEGADARGAAPMKLQSRSRLDRFVVDGKGRDRALGDTILWPAFIAALACAGVALARQRARRDQERLVREQHVAWAKNLAPGAESAVQGASDDLETARKLVTHALKVKGDALHVQTQKRQALETQLRAKEEEIQKVRHRLAELAELDSLAMQLARTTKTFLARMEAFRGKAEDLEDLAEAGLAARGKALLGRLKEWEEGVAARGARKFLRSLSETPVEEGSERSQLDEQLAELSALAGELADQSLGATALARGLLETAAFASRIAGLWHGIALRTHADEPAKSLAGPLEEAQTLLSLEDGGMSVAFSNGVTAADLAAIPPLPATVWVTTLYHVYLAMAELARGSKAVIATRMRHDGERTLLVVQVAAASGEPPLPKRGDSQPYHLEVSKAILAPFEVALSVLPVLDGPFPVVLAWPRVGGAQPHGTAAERGAEATT